MQLSKLNVHIMRGDPMMVAGLHAILSAHPDLNVTVHVANPEALLDARIVVTDYESGLAVARSEAQDSDNAPRILIVTNRRREGEVRQAMDAGVHGYLLECGTAGDLVYAVRQLDRGLGFMSEGARRGLVESQRHASLTMRETDVLRLLAKGWCNKSIARELDIGLGTVKTHVRGLMNKLDASARTEVVVVAAQRGLVMPGTSPQLAL
ncbi:LuxR C-terminal-related transcriptional regulator [Pseudoduganella sp. RAF53_2]|uniref:LuxR C-terminal-related transcriptional regulator n=1 Tax=unclassified Pseudoduganella TaxID=2637179 RepID=UPI003F9DC229